MKNTSIVQHVAYQPNWDITFKPFNYIRKLNAWIIKTFTLKKRVTVLQNQLDESKKLTEQLQWEIIKKNEYLKNVTFHQSHCVRKPLANILGIIDLVNINKTEIDNSEIFEMINLLKISADELDKAIKSNSLLS